MTDRHEIDQYPKNVPPDCYCWVSMLMPLQDRLANAHDLLHRTLSEYSSSLPFLERIRHILAFSTNSAIWAVQTAKEMASHRLTEVKIVGFRDPLLHPPLRTLPHNVVLEVDQHALWKEKRKYDVIHSREIGYMNNWPEFRGNVQHCLAAAGELRIEIVGMIPLSDDGSLHKDSALLKLSRMLWEPPRTSKEPIVDPFTITQDLEKIGMIVSTVHRKLPINKYSDDEKEKIIGDWFAITMNEFIKARVALAGERLALDDELVEKARKETEDTTIHAYCN
ncbi:methyltransferase domain-containing protein [Colletotrichum kahawae]|uniref:Methyltransferase domain-containing protein n=1 Tax=Colletotrichum kahawae TaxID=34407 RepID=A0AAD9YKZ3_COLKA|nr:methyltransferase domain-containing protein [Colletotrichum kahawae]